jgi:hypothetical protein
MDMQIVDYCREQAKLYYDKSVMAEEQQDVENYFEALILEEIFTAACAFLHPHPVVWVHDALILWRESSVVPRYLRVAQRKLSEWTARHVITRNAWYTDADDTVWYIEINGETLTITALGAWIQAFLSGENPISFEMPRNENAIVGLADYDTVADAVDAYYNTEGLTDYEGIDEVYEALHAFYKETN